MALIDASPSIEPVNVPFFNSKAVVPFPACNPKSALASFTLTAPPAESSAVTLLPTAIISVPDFLNPKSPDRLTKSVIVPMNPITETLFRPFSTSIFALTEFIVIVSVTLAPVSLNLIATEVADALAKSPPLNANVPDASNAFVPLSLRIKAREPLLTPTSKSPAFNFAATPEADAFT